MLLYFALVLLHLFLAEILWWKVTIRARDLDVWDLVFPLSLPAVFDDFNLLLHCLSLGDIASQESHRYSETKDQSCSASSEALLTYEKSIMEISNMISQGQSTLSEVYAGHTLLILLSSPLYGQHLLL